MTRNQFGIRALGSDVNGTSISHNVLLNNDIDLVDTASGTTIVQPTSVSTELRHWDTGQTVVSAVQAVTLAPAADLQGLPLNNAFLFDADLNHSDFTSTNLYQALLSTSNLDGANLGNAWLVDAHLDATSLLDSNLADTVVQGAGFEGTAARGFTMAQLAVTASYQAKDLRATRWSDNDLSAWNFASQNLSTAQFFNTRWPTLTLPARISRMRGWGRLGLALLL